MPLNMLTGIRKKITKNYHEEKKRMKIVPKKIY